MAHTGMGRSAWIKSEDYVSKFCMYGANLRSSESEPTEAHFKQHYIWLNSSQDLQRLLFLGRIIKKKTPQRVEFTVSKLVYVSNSLRLGQRTSFTGGAEHIAGMYQIRLVMNSS